MVENSPPPSENRPDFRRRLASLKNEVSQRVAKLSPVKKIMAAAIVGIGATVIATQFLRPPEVPAYVPPTPVAGEPGPTPTERAYLFTREPVTYTQEALAELMTKSDTQSYIYMPNRGGYSMVGYIQDGYVYVATEGVLNSDGTQSGKLLGDKRPEDIGGAFPIIAIEGQKDGSLQMFGFFYPVDEDDPNATLALGGGPPPLNFGPEDGDQVRKAIGNFAQGILDFDAKLRKAGSPGGRLVSASPQRP